MKTDEQIDFGKHLRKLRQQMGLTQEKLGVLTGLHRNYISSVERGQRNLTLQTILALAKGLETHPANLFDYINS